MSKINLNEFEGHSPGPWWVDEWEDGDGESMPERYWSVEQDIIQVCLVYNEQDARLIAAVPDLVAALIEAQKYKRVLDKLYKMADADPDWKELIDETWAALE